MSIRSDPLDALVVPDGTTAKEHDIVTDRDVVVGGGSDVEFGVRGRNVMAGERARFGGDIEAERDCRLDVWCDVNGNLLVGTDAYLGERVHVGGRLVVGGDLDIGDDVQIEEGFEANGWIEIRSPVPTVVFLMMYLSHLLRLGETDAVEELVSEAFDEEEGETGQPLVIPRNSDVSDDAWRVSTPARIGSDCRLHGNVRAQSIEVGTDTNLFGSLRGRGDITIAEGAKIHGDVTTRGGDVTLEPGALVLGDVSGEDLRLDREAEIEGSIRSSGEMQLGARPSREPE